MANTDRSGDPLTRALRAPVRTDADLHAFWRRVWGEPGTSTRALWLLVLDAEHRPVPSISRVDDLPVRPRPDDVDQVGWFLGQLVAAAGGASVACLLARPGGRRLTADDRLWGRTLLAAAERAGVACRPVHVAGDEDVVVVAGDDMVVPRAG